LSSNSDVDTALKEVSATGYKNLRVWAFGDVNILPEPTATDPNKIYFQVLNSTGSYINYGADGLQRLDYVVSAAEKYGIKLVLPFVNNWGDYGEFCFLFSFRFNIGWYSESRRISFRFSARRVFSENVC